MSGKLSSFALAAAALAGAWAAPVARADDALDEEMAYFCSMPPDDPVEIFDEETMTLLWAGPAHTACEYILANYAGLSPLLGDAGDTACKTRPPGRPFSGQKCNPKGAACTKGGAAGICKETYTQTFSEGHFTCACDVPPPPSDLFSSPWLALGTLGLGSLLIGGARTARRLPAVA